jgi:putative DNA primase/helicase
MNASDFAADLESARRIMSNATPDRRIAIFTELCGEFIRWTTVGGIEKAKFQHALREIGLDAELTEDEIKDALAEADKQPFEPTPPAKTSRGNGSTLARSAQLVIKQASEIQPEKINWLWPNRIAIGKLTLLAGEPGLGKSQLTCAMTATVTTGGRWPGDEGPAQIGSVIILSAEDDAADTIIPRLDAAGADLTRIFIISAVKGEYDKGHRSFNLQSDLMMLENKIAEIGDVHLVVIDPVSSYLGKVDSHRNAELRSVLEPIGEMSSRLGVATLAVTHLNKNGGGGANNRVIGSIAFVATVRAAFIVARDPDDKERRLFLPTKNNLSPEGSGLGFRIGQVETTSGILAPMIIWDTIAVRMSAEEALAGSADGSSAPARDEAENFLRDILADGPVPAKKIKAEVREAELVWRTIRRAKEAIGVTVRKTGVDGGWEWSLPEGGQR